MLSYTEARTARSSRRASPRPARMAELHRRRHRPTPPGRADGAVLHLLLDVRLPAGRRPDLGGGRRPGPRLPARCHRRAHHAARRRPAAPGRPLPRAGVHGADLPGLRPGLRLRGGRHRARTASPACTAARAAREDRSSTTSPSTTRTTRCPPAPDGVATRTSSRACTAGPRRPTGRRRQRHDPVLGIGARARPARPRRPLAEHHGVGAELWSATVVQGAAGGRPRRSSGGTGSTRTGRAPHTPYVTELLGQRSRARSSPSPTS